MKIFLAYDAENGAIACYWEYFFKSCGVWAEKKLFEEMLQIPDDFTGIAMVSPKDLEELPAGSLSGYAYRLPEARWAADRKPLSWNRSAELKYDYRNIIKSVFEESLCGMISLLFEIYFRNELWKACWFYEEFAKGDSVRWDEYIVQICEKGLKDIWNNIRRYGENEYIRYMEFYYRYILYGVKFRFLSQRQENCGRLREEYLPVLNRYRQNAMFQHLAGRICELTSVANKMASIYYLQAVRYQACSVFYYDLGHVFEKAYGNDKRALKFYTEAYKLDRDNYKALYKLASGYEVQRKWMEAYYFYNKIDAQLSRTVEINYETGNAVSAQEIEYLYKVRKRLSHIYRLIFGCEYRESNSVYRIDEVTDTYLCAKSFRALEQFMEEPGKGGEIAEELNSKFTGACFQ